MHHHTYGCVCPSNSCIYDDVGIQSSAIIMTRSVACPIVRLTFSNVYLISRAYGIQDAGCKCESHTGIISTVFVLPVYKCLSDGLKLR